METTVIFQPLSARVYVNLPEGIIIYHLVMTNIAMENPL